MDGRLMISTEQVEGKNTSKSNQNVKKKRVKKPQTSTEKSTTINNFGI